jgi:hypothetical protein
MKYNRKGIVAEDGDKIFAQTVDGSVKTIYYVLTYNNLVYDPLGSDSNRESKLTTQLKPTSKKTFDSYIKYLQSRNRIHITMAQRSFING